MRRSCATRRSQHGCACRVCRGTSRWRRRRARSVWGGSPTRSGVRRRRWRRGAAGRRTTSCSSTRPSCSFSASSRGASPSSTRCCRTSRRARRCPRGRRRSRRCTRRSAGATRGLARRARAAQRDASAAQGHPPHRGPLPAARAPPLEQRRDRPDLLLPRGPDLSGGVANRSRRGGRASAGRASAGRPSAGRPSAGRASAGRPSAGRGVMHDRREVGERAQRGRRGEGVVVSDLDRLSHGRPAGGERDPLLAARSIAHSLPKKSFPLSSTTMNAGKSSTSIFHTASMPSSGYSSTSTLRMLFCARIAAGPPIEPR